MKEHQWKLSGSADGRRRRKKKKEKLASYLAETKINGWTTTAFKTSHDEFPKWVRQFDMEFISNRRDWIKGSERILPEDRTLTMGVPTEALKDPEVRAMILSDHFEEKPLEWYEEVI